MALMSKRDLTPEEQKAWDRVRKSVRPLHAGRKPKPAPDLSNAPELKPAKPEPRSADTAKPSKSAPPRHRGQTVATPQDRGHDRKVRRGKIDISARFDLHGHTQQSAWSALPAFLQREQARGSRCVIVITGKGKLGEGVLKRNFLHWLELPEARSLVSGYARAHPRHGGSGAFYVFLRRR